MMPLKKTFVLLLIFLSTASFAQKNKKDVLKSIDSKYDQYATIAKTIWDYAEVGFQETKSSALLQETLSANGFEIEKGVAGMPTAFVASYGSGKPVIGILGEFDALPGVAQQAVPTKTPIEGQVAGHACGHHLFGTASSAAAIAIKDWMEANKKQGTIRFYGTPAEEGGSGKVYMVREGLFKDVDAVINWHPGPANSASPGNSLANKTGKFRFYGVAAHAAAAPHRGRSALDGVEAMNVMVNMMREHVTSETRIHYVITRGGEAPNVVPAFAEVYYYVRHPDRSEVKDVWERIVNAAKGAALGTDTKVEYEITGGVHDLLPNETLAKAMHANLVEVGGYSLTEEETKFALEIQKSFTGKAPSLKITEEIAPYQLREGSASTDVGDVSWVVPTVGMSAATWVPGTAGHSWQAVAAGGTTIGMKGMMIAAKSMALMGIDLFSNPTLMTEAWNEFKQKTADFKYEALIGDRAPALDYRK